MRDATYLDLMPIAQMSERYYNEVIDMKNHTFCAVELMKNIAMTIASPDGFVRLLIVDGKMVGGVWGCITQMPWSNVRFAQDFIIFIEKGHRTHGKFMIDDWTAWAKERGAKEVCLSTASGIETSRTCKLFERYGFKLTGHSYLKEIK